MRSKFGLLLIASAALAGCGYHAAQGDVPARGVEPVNVPVVTHADYVFDVRMLPNPHYEPALRDLTGLDAPVADFLRQQPDVELMVQHIRQFLSHWLEMLDRNHRSYVTVAVGCTGGQHRSTYIVEQLTQVFSDRWTVQRRHRELDGR